ncbi:hypothetical protein EDB86DRAFT_2829861 [Lactarius hatsudake]|nr:hypothetical protein EDB86DRAFT_2829861 [Lactarius hatsudake]
MTAKEDVADVKVLKVEAHRHKPVYRNYAIVTRTATPKSTRRHSWARSHPALSPLLFFVSSFITTSDYLSLLWCTAPNSFAGMSQTPKSPNPFVVNESRLKNNFRRVQRYVHPDLWATQGKPLSRIHYILSQHNLGVLETDQLHDPHLITEVIEIREALEDASTESEVDDIKKDVAGKISETMENIEHAVQVEDWAEAHRGAVRLKYLRSIEAAAQSSDNRRTGDNQYSPVVARKSVEKAAFMLLYIRSTLTDGPIAVTVRSSRDIFLFDRP